MYAVIESGGKQYRVAPGAQVAVERLDKPAGEQVAFERVLLVRTDAGVQVGRPLVEKVKVLGEVLAQERREKVLVFKKKRRKNYRRTQGHRQSYSSVKILEIQGA